MSTIIATTLSNGSVSVPTATVVNGSAKAWVNFNGTGAVAIRDSFNTSSITDNGTGDYTVNFTTAMPDVNYAVGLAASDIAYGTVPYIYLTATTLAGSCRFQNRGNEGASPILRDVDIFAVSIFR